MKLQIMSDLHFEMHADGGAGLIRELDPTGVEVLVLAGDITMARHYANLEGVFKPLALGDHLKTGHQRSGQNRPPAERTRLVGV